MHHTGHQFKITRCRSCHTDFQSNYIHFDCRITQILYLFEIPSLDFIFCMTFDLEALRGAGWFCEKMFLNDVVSRSERFHSSDL